MGPRAKTLALRSSCPALSPSAFSGPELPGALDDLASVAAVAAAVPTIHNQRLLLALHLNSLPEVELATLAPDGLKIVLRSESWPVSQSLILL